MNLLRSKRLLLSLRRISLILAGLGGLYLWQRYEVFPLPQGGCSPLLSLRPGSTLWVDRKPTDLGIGDVIFFSLPSGAIGFGRCTRTRDSQLWLETDAENCPAQDSSSLGWIDPELVHGRLIMAFGNSSS